MRRVLLGLLCALAAFPLASITASACGGLVAPNGAIRLNSVTTFVAYHDGVERYLTSFEYQGAVTDVGWIVPLPAVPTKVEEGGGWTLQRLQREVNPPAPSAEDLAFSASAGTPVEVLQQVQVRALDITVLRGSASAVIDWAENNKFLMSDETKAHLFAYANTSPIFMAAKYDVARALSSGQLSGDGAPVLITMPVTHAWVPLEVLANGLDPVNADVFLLTDDAPRTGTELFSFMSPEGQELPGAPGFEVRRQFRMSESLQRDLASDKNMAWMPKEGWITYLHLGARSDVVTYDMTLANGRMNLASLGTPMNHGGTSATVSSEERFTPRAPAAAAALLLLCPLAGALSLVALRRRIIRRRGSI